MKRLLFLLILSVGLCHAAQAQKIQITSEPFYNAIKPFRDRSVKGPSRGEAREEVYRHGVIYKTTVSVFESIPAADARRSRTTIVTNGVVWTREEVEIGVWLYTKTNDEPWEKQQTYFRHGLTDEFGQRLDTMRFWRECLPAEKVTVFSNTDEIERDKTWLQREEAYYFSNSGTPLKNTITERTLDGKVVLKFEASFPRHDPTIKIEAPIK